LIVGAIEQDTARMKRHARLIAALCSAFVAHAGALASDPPCSDPDRVAHRIADIRATCEKDVLG
jgi:hypothetical protein